MTLKLFQSTFGRTLVFGSLGLALGCGGTSTQDDMRRFAMKRPKDDEDEKPTPPQKATSEDAGESQESGEAEASPAGKNKPLAKPPAEQPDDSPRHANTDNARPDLPSTHSTLQPPVADEQTSNPDADAATTVTLDPTEQRQQTIENLNAIGSAWAAYFRKNKYSPEAIDSPTGKPLLSWRVQLLPYLGHETLYDKFRLDERWDSPHNKSLLAQIPVVYKSPARADSATNYLAVHGRNTMYQGSRKVVERRIEDGKENCLIIVEANDTLAVPWTKPVDYAADLQSPLSSLGKLHGDGFFAVWGDGASSWIPANVPSRLLAAAYTIDAGDGFIAEQIAQDATASLKPTEGTLADTTAPVVEPSPTAGAPSLPAAKPPASRRTVTDAIASVRSSASIAQVTFKRQPIPEGPKLKVARDLLSELFKEDYGNAKTKNERVSLARRMLDRLPDLGTDYAGQYAILDISRQIAIQAAYVDVAIDTTDQLAARFEVDADLMLDTFEKLARVGRDRGTQSRLLEEADEVFEELVIAEAYTAAGRLSQLAVSAASKVNDEDAVEKYTVRRQWADEARSLRRAADEALEVLDERPKDPRANGDVGRFLCLIKGDWENGIVVLASGSDRSLKRLAAMELDDLDSSMKQLELADLWWRESEMEAVAFKETLQNRAKYWYEQALPGLPAGLVRIRVERRIEEIGKQSA